MWNDKWISYTEQSEDDIEFHDAEYISDMLHHLPFKHLKSVMLEFDDDSFIRYERKVVNS